MEELWCVFSVLFLFDSQKHYAMRIKARDYIILEHKVMCKLKDVQVIFID